MTDIGQIRAKVGHNRSSGAVIMYCFQVLKISVVFRQKVMTNRLGTYWNRMRELSFMYDFLNEKLPM